MQLWKHYSPFVLPSQCHSNEGICYGQGGAACSLRSRSYGCSSAPSLLFKLQQPLLPLGFLLCVRGSREAAMQPSLPCYQPKSSWCKKHNLATWKVWGCSAHGSPSQMVWHRARGRWFAGSTNLQQALGISWIQPITLKTSNVVVRDSFSSSSVTAQQ